MLHHFVYNLISVAGIIFFIGVCLLKNPASPLIKTLPEKLGQTRSWMCHTIPPTISLFENQGNINNV